jgi:hypothetical protein
MALNGKAKRDAFAIQCSVALSRWATRNRSTDVFKRSAGGVVSAAWDHQFARRYRLDCTHLDDLHWESVIYGGEGVMSLIWDQPLAKAQKLGQAPLCVVKQTTRAELVLTTAETFEAFWEASGGHLQCQFMLARDGRLIHVWLFQQLLTRVDPDVLFGPRAVAG